MLLTFFKIFSLPCCLFKVLTSCEIHSQIYLHVSNERKVDVSRHVLCRNATCFILIMSLSHLLSNRNVSLCVEGCGFVRGSGLFMNMHNEVAALMMSARTFTWNKKKAARRDLKMKILLNHLSTQLRACLRSLTEEKIFSSENIEMQKKEEKNSQSRKVVS